MLNLRLMKNVIVVCLITCLAKVTVVRADELSELRQQVESQQQALAQVQAKLLELETPPEQATTAPSESPKAADGGDTLSLPKGLEWLKAIKPFGDFRYRYEYNSWDDDAGAKEHRNRNFIRLRVGMKAEINDEIGLTTRVITGSDNPVGANQTLGNESEKEFASRGIWLDHAYVAYTPQAIGSFKVMAGKMPTPFFRPGSSQLIWDSDLSPEGVALQYDHNLTGKLNAFAQASYLVVEEDKNGDSGLELCGFVGGLKQSLSCGMLSYGAGYFNYANTAGHVALGNGFKGNSSADSLYLYDYSLLELFADCTTQVKGLPVRLYGDYVQNTASDVEEDTGWLVGTTLGKANAPGSSQCGYEYRDLDADCVVGTFSDSVFIGGGTGGRGHKLNVKYQLLKNTQFSATYCRAQRIAGTDGEKDDDYQKMQLDFIVKF